MKRSELNEIIRTKITNNLDETDEMKSYLLDILDNELKNVFDGVKVRFTDKYMQDAITSSQKEMKKNVAIRNKD